VFSIPRETGAKSTSSDSQPKGDAHGPRMPKWSRPIAWWSSAMALPLGIFLITYWQQGFVAAGRAATAMVMPVSWVWLSLWGATLWQASLGHRRRSVGLLILFVLWTAVGNHRVATTAMRWVETPIPIESHPAFEKRDESERLDALVTLGGSAGWTAEGFPEINADGERIVSAAQAYHAGMTRTIITTGSSTDGIADPCEVSRDLLISLGVPENHIFPIPGQNTGAEMAFLVKFLEAPPAEWDDLVSDPADPVVGLVTSAFHLPRALRLARAQGLEVVPIPCAFRVNQTPRPGKASDWIPTSESQSTLGLVIKETIAWFLGR